MSLADLRKDYTLAGLRRAELDTDPIRQFQKWFQQALDAGLLEPSAMTLATADQKGRPSARIVLLKGVDERDSCSSQTMRAAKDGSSPQIQTRRWCFIGPHWSVK